GRGKGRVAEPAPAAVCDDDLLPVFRQVAQDIAPIPIEDQRPRRHGEDQIASLPAVTVIWHPGAAGRGSPVLAVDDLRQVVGPGNGTDNDGTAVAAIAAVGTALGDVLFPAKTAT